MTGLQKRLVGAVASAAVLLNSAMPVFATEIVISGNGAGSDNYATVSQTTTTTVAQNNTAVVNNQVGASATTGNNDSSFNTGGDSVISTGDASTTVDVSTDMNSNSAQVDCCASAGDTTVKIDGNGAFSDNLVTLDQTSTTTVAQYNTAYVDNRVYANANSGDNNASSNTGGATAILTGKASTDVTISNSGNTNAAVVSGGNPANTPSASFIISGNGAGSDNWISASLLKATTLAQNNNADIDNYVHAKAESGDNKASFNTGGDNLIHTGKATSTVGIDNSVNFNYADIDCGCTWDVLAKITGNSADPFKHHHRKSESSDVNGITLGLESFQTYAQNNGASLDNVVASGAKASSGDNELFANTGEPGGDPAILTGNASTDVTVTNSGNVNQIGGGFPMPWWPEDLSGIDFSFNLGTFLAFFGFSF